MNVNGVKTYIGNKKSLVEVRRKNAKMPDVRWINVFRGFSERIPGRVDAQTC